MAGPTHHPLLRPFAAGLLLLTAMPCWARPTGGIALDPGPEGSFADVRATALPGPAGNWKVQPTVRAGGASGDTSLSVQVPVLVADLDQVRAGPGQLRLTGLHRLGSTGWKPSLGLALGVPTWAPAQLPAWTALPWETLPGVDAMAVLDLARAGESVDLSARCWAGVRSTVGQPGVRPILVVAAAGTAWASDRIGWLTELEATTDHSQAVGRTAVRVAWDRTALDLGLQVNVGASQGLWQPVTGGLVVQVRRHLK